MPVRTGYERVMSHRVDDLYAKCADESGEILDITDKGMKVKYKDGRIEHYEIGRRFGNWSGHVIPHNVIAARKVGDKFKKDDVLTYNDNFFKVDRLDPSQIVQTNSVLAAVVMVETGDTLEDSCAISESFAKKLVTDGTHTRVIKVNFDQDVKMLVKDGSEVDYDTVVCVLQNQTAGRSDIFDEKALETLRLISALTPKAKAHGKVEKIEVFYAGEVEDMSESLREVVETSDRNLFKLRKQLGKKAVAGQVDPGFRVEGTPLDVNTAIIRVYITGEMPMGIGDKGVISLQLKTICGRIMEGVNETESGVPIDVHFSYLSEMNRIVNSARLLGTTGRLMVAASQAVVEAYEKR